MKLETHSKEKIEIIQSYIVTTARYDFNVYEKRTLYRIVEMIQFLLQGKKLNARHRIEKDLFDLYNVEMPISALMNDEEDKNHVRVKDALRRMSDKKFEYEDDEVWRLIPLIMLPEIKKHDSIVKFRLHEDIYNALLNFSKGFKKYELKTAFQFESVYTMRFYELFSNQRTPLNFSIENLKLMFGLEKKYAKPTDFIKRVVEQAKEELDKKSPYSFEYTPLKSGKRITSIRFYPIQIPQNVDEEFEAQRLRKILSPSFMIEKQNLQYLKEHYKFSTPEIRNNIDLFERAQKEIPDLLMFLSEVKAKANRAGNPKGYLINALRRRLKIKVVKIYAKKKDEGEKTEEVGTLLEFQKKK